MSDGSVVEAARAIQREIVRTQLRARKGIALLARRPPTGVGSTPKDEVWSLGKARLWRYRSEHVRHGPPVLLFLGLVGDPAVFDLHPGNSWAERLVSEGFDVYLFDWGVPDAAEADHSLETYLGGYFVHAVDAVREISGAPTISLGAYCMGALMVLLLLGSRSAVPVHSLVLFTPPVDFSHSPAFLAPYQEGRLRPEDAVDTSTGLVPDGAVRGMFRLLQPTSELVQAVTLWENLWRDDYVPAHRAVAHWAWSHRAMAGTSFLELMTDLVRDNALAAGTARLGGRHVDLATVTVPVLVVVAERDQFVLPESSAALPSMLGSADVEVLTVPGGHAGALMGSGARRVTMPAVVDCLACRSTASPSTAPQPSAAPTPE